FLALFEGGQMVRRGPNICNGLLRRPLAAFGRQAPSPPLLKATLVGDDAELLARSPQGSWGNPERAGVLLSVLRRDQPAGQFLLQEVHRLGQYYAESIR